jgi:hypothetical protein
VRINPANLVGLVLLLLALLGAWRTRLDLAAGETRWFGWSRLPAPRRRRDSPWRYWVAMLLNIAIVLLVTLAGAVAMRVGLLQFIHR